MMTGTHGSGYQVLANRILAFDVVLADGRLKTFSLEDTPGFKHHILTFGGLGIITSMTMRIVENFKVRKSKFTDLPWDTCFENFDKIYHG